ncbi:hypothetical protein BDB00DRAFT_941179 [Zychaea mexicana]|uniref:uncharacterized protein n=1 Tax=Zychaea mexicana TaxID=64656 RepID=UPI0022FDE526|nr:uncharacterized protein BDB00DRAFT_941179 [Zychaea mexicana]KAI9490172.1 hypothetical protein BDB00DRAFT_941179 [Zychaea mexicana]
MSTAAAAPIPAWLAWYLAQLAANPLRTKACTSGVLAGMQELTAQKLSGVKKIDKRVIQMALYGLFISGPLNHYLYEIMYKLLAGKSPKQAKIGQLLFSNFVISPTMNSVYLTAMTILAGGRSLAQVKTAVRGGLLSMQKVSWCVSPVTLIFAQNFLPQYTWVPFFQIVAFCVGTYMNTMIKKKRMQAAQAAAKEAEKKE